MSNQDRFSWGGADGDIPDSAFSDPPKALGGPGSGNFGHGGRPGERGGSAPAGGAPAAEPKITKAQQAEAQRAENKRLAREQKNPLARPPFVLGDPGMVTGLGDYVAAHGQEFKVPVMPPNVDPDPAEYPMGQCYRNASLLVIKHPELTFAEGYATGPAGLTYLHAWAVTKDDEVVDVTWSGKPDDRAPSRYFGVKYDRTRYLKYLYTAKYYGVLGSTRQNAQKAIDTGGKKLR